MNGLFFSVGFSVTFPDALALALAAAEFLLSAPLLPVILVVALPSLPSLVLILVLDWSKPLFDALLAAKNAACAVSFLALICASVKPAPVFTLNLQTRIGDAAEKSVCPLIKTELNGAFNNLLDEYQSKYKSIFDEQVANRGNPKPKITNTGRSGKGSLGGDTQKKPKAIGESKDDQAVMQS